VKLVIDDL